MPRWLYPITPATLAILGLVLLFVALVVDTFVQHWREDRRDDQR